MSKQESSTKPKDTTTLKPTLQTKLKEFKEQPKPMKQEIPKPPCSSTPTSPNIPKEKKISPPPGPPSEPSNLSRYGSFLTNGTPQVAQPPSQDQSSKTKKRKKDHEQNLDGTTKKSKKSKLLSSPLQHPTPTAFPLPPIKKEKKKPSLQPAPMQVDLGLQPGSEITKDGIPFFVPPKKPETLDLRDLAAAEKQLLRLAKHDFSKFNFGLPVLETYPDPVFKQNYLSVVTQPMDLKTIFFALYSGQYTTSSEILSDLRLIYNNAIDFNSLNEETDETAKLTKLYAKHMDLYTKHLFAEREQDWPQTDYNNIMTKLEAQGKILIDFKQLFCFSLEGRSKATKQLIDEDMDKFHRPNIDPQIDLKDLDYLKEVNLFLYIEFNDVINLSSLTKAENLLNDEKILVEERQRRRVQNKMRFDREKMVEEIAIEEHKNYAHLVKLLGKLTHSNKRSINIYFLSPFDYKAANLLSYPEIVKKPMDFQTVRTNLEKKRYKNLKDFAEEVRLIFENCLRFTRTNANDYNIVLRRSCVRMSKFWEKLWGDFTLNLMERLMRRKAEEEFDKFQKKLQSKVRKEEEIKLRLEQEKSEKENAMLARQQNPNAIFQPVRVSEDGTILKSKLNKHSLEKQKKIWQRRKQKEAEMKLFQDTNEAIQLAEWRVEQRNRFLLKKQEDSGEEKMGSTFTPDSSLNLDVSFHFSARKQLIDSTNLWKYDELNSVKDSESIMAIDNQLLFPAKETSLVESTELPALAVGNIFTPDLKFSDNHNLWAFVIHTASETALKESLFIFVSEKAERNEFLKKKAINVRNIISCTTEQLFFSNFSSNCSSVCISVNENNDSMAEPIVIPDKYRSYRVLGSKSKIGIRAESAVVLQLDNRYYEGLTVSVLHAPDLEVALKTNENSNLP